MKAATLARGMARQAEERFRTRAALDSFVDSLHRVESPPGADVPRRTLVALGGAEFPSSGRGETGGSVPTSASAAAVLRA